MKLPKAGTKVEDLKCPKCGISLKDLLKQEPLGLVMCEQLDCPQKPVVEGET